MSNVIKREQNGIEYVRLSDLTPANRVLLGEFLVGSQVPVFEGEVDVAYYWDYIAWRKSEK